MGTERFDADDRIDDGIQHGIDDDPHNDAQKGATLGGIGGVAVGAAAGATMGPVGAVIGAVVGGIAGAAASGAAVAAIDRNDNDDTVSGLGDDVDLDEDDFDPDHDANLSYDDTGVLSNRELYREETLNQTPTLATAGGAAPITTSAPITAQAATPTASPTAAPTAPTDAFPLPDIRQEPVDAYSMPGYTQTRDRDEHLDYAASSNFGDTLSDPSLTHRTQDESDMESAFGGNQIPGIQTGGTAIDGTPDTRGIMEKTADALTGDRIDDKTGKPVR